MESTYPQRVVRDENGAITLVDNSLLNLYRRETDGWDLNLAYGIDAPAGRFEFSLVHSRILTLSDQWSPEQPADDAAGHHPEEGGAPRNKASGALTWEKGALMAGWAVRYIGPYKMYGAAGGPESARNFGGAEYSYYIQAQGGAEVASQIYH